MSSLRLKLIATKIATHPPYSRGKARKAYIDWRLIERLRTILVEESGIDWEAGYKQQHAKRTASP